MATTIKLSMIPESSSRIPAVTAGSAALETHLQLLQHHHSSNQQYERDMNEYNNDVDEDIRRITSSPYLVSAGPSLPVLINTSASLHYNHPQSLRSFPIPIQQTLQTQQHYQNTIINDRPAFHDDYMTSDDDDRYSVSSDDSSGSGGRRMNDHDIMTSRHDVVDVLTALDNMGHNGKSKTLPSSATSRSLPTRFLLRAPYLGSRRVPTSPAVSSYGFSSSSRETTPTVSTNYHYPEDDEGVEYLNEHNNNRHRGDSASSGDYKQHAVSWNTNMSRHQKEMFDTTNWLPPSAETFLSNLDDKKNQSSNGAYVSYDQRGGSKSSKMAYGSLNESSLRWRWDRIIHNNNLSADKSESTKSTSAQNIVWRDGRPYQDSHQMNQQEASGSNQSNDAASNVSLKDPVRNDTLKLSLSALNIDDDPVPIQQGPNLHRIVAFPEAETKDHNESDDNNNNSVSQSNVQEPFSSQGLPLSFPEVTGVKEGETNKQKYVMEIDRENEANSRALFPTREKTVIDSNMMSTLSSPAIDQAIIVPPPAHLFSTSYGGGGGMMTATAPTKLLTTGLDILRGLKAANNKVESINATRKQQVDREMNPNIHAALLSRSYQQHQHSWHRNFNDPFSTNIRQYGYVNNLGVTTMTQADPVATNEGFPSSPQPIHFPNNPDTEGAFELDL